MQAKSGFDNFLRYALKDLKSDCSVAVSGKDSAIMLIAVIPTLSISSITLDKYLLCLLPLLLSKHMQQKYTKLDMVSEAEKSLLVRRTTHTQNRFFPMLQIGCQTGKLKPLVRWAMLH